MQQVTVRVPASTSNLGPGFDCLGVALRIYNRVTVARGSGNSQSPLATSAARLFFTRAKTAPFAFGCSLSGDVPRARGLGSSATVRAGVLLALNELAGKPLARSSIFELCAELEGHPDNAAPAVFGGFTVVRGPHVQRFPVSPRLRFVLLIPQLEISTSAARKILPARIRRADAVKTCGNACAVTAAFVSRKYSALQGAFGDHLHQPFRRKLIPFLPAVIAAAEKAGALGAFLSGSGSTIGAITLESPAKVGGAMLAAVGSHDTKIIITSADNQGARFLKIHNS
jgi:homoserine kinase